MAGSKGGKPGQWSARKAQMVASAYKKAGGGYKGSHATANEEAKEKSRPIKNPSTPSINKKTKRKIEVIRNQVIQYIGCLSCY